MRATCFDYGAGNLHSLGRALDRLGVTMRTDDDAERSLHDTELWILPGVGAFGPAAERLAPARDAIRRALAGGLPCLGVCLGMQLLFESSEEAGPDEPTAGLGVFAGRVTRLETPRRPHIGWSYLEADQGFRRGPTNRPTKEAPRGEGTPKNDAFSGRGGACRPLKSTTRRLSEFSPTTSEAMYFAHSYACRPLDPGIVTAWATHGGDRFAASVRRGRVAGVQFHPEKSSGAGLALLGRLIRELTS
jgi:glutamine amidotransferase